MNQGIFGLPPSRGPNYNQSALMHPLAYIDVMNANLGGINSTLYYLPYGFQATGSSLTVTANILYLVPFWIGKPAIVKNLTIRSVVPTISGNVKFSFYDSESTTGLPNNLLFSSISVARASGYGVTSVYSGHVLQINTPGFYWVGLVYDAAVDGVEKSTGMGANPMPSSATIANYQTYGIYTGLTFGDPPSSLIGNKITIVDSYNSIPLPQIVMSSQLQNIVIQKG